MKEQVFVSVVLYAQNNEREISQALIDVDRTMMNHFKNYEIILVNDFSQDNTLEEAQKAIQNIYGDTTIINLSRKHGVEHAMMAGLNKSMGDFVLKSNPYQSTLIWGCCMKCLKSQQPKALILLLHHRDRLTGSQDYFTGF